MVSQFYHVHLHVYARFCRPEYVNKQRGTINQMGCCDGEVYNLTETYCSSRETVEKCSINDLDSFKCDNFNCIDKSK